MNKSYKENLENKILIHELENYTFVQESQKKEFYIRKLEKDLEYRTWEITFVHSFLS